MVTPAVDGIDLFKIAGRSISVGHLLVNLEQHTLGRKLPLALLPPDAPPIVPDTLPSTLLPQPEAVPPSISLSLAASS